MTNTPNPIDIHVGGRVRELRILRGMSQSRLAQHCGLSFQQIQKYERAANRIGASRLAQIAAALATTPAYFFEGLTPSGQTAEDTGAFRREHLELIRDFDGLGDDLTRKRFRDLVHALATEHQRIRAAAE